MKRVLFICGLLCCMFAFSLSAQAADRTLTADDGNSLVLQQSSKQDFFRYSNEDSPFAFDIPDLFTKAVSVDGNTFELSDATGNCLFSAASFKTVGRLTIGQYLKATREHLSVKPAYEKLGKNFFVLSWIEDGKIHYQKTYLNVDAACIIEFTYPADRKKEFDPLVTHSANSLKFTW
ncbi:hypothetical protein LJC26_07645 [Desulfovibrio sp. OttesenSCG-928-O18]|nr:hypothetical protein [Desulfovibrio sp. OttesenSCG-928-O18]